MSALGHYGQTVPGENSACTFVGMSKLIRVLILATSCVALLAIVTFIVVATRFNLLIVIPAILSAAYLASSATYATILPDNN